MASGDPTGLSNSQITAQVAQAEALGEMQVPPLPPGQLTAILAKLRKDLTVQP